MSSYKFTPRAVASPDAPQKPLVRKRARSGGAEWVQVTQHPAKQVKKPRPVGSQQPACTHKEHQILSTSEAASFASQFWDRKVHPTKASRHEFLATCIDVKKYVPIHKQGDVCPSGVPALVEQDNNADDSGPCIVQFPAVCSKSWSPTPPPPNPYISEMAFSHRFQKVYIYPPLQGTIFWHIG